ncbi:MAG TPA: hypothetical protein VM529_24885 [Gemmata sp.]|jgi:hypothetical protein|nr:hypothetical protein [Gemmata sp.]
MPTIRHPIKPTTHTWRVRWADGRHADHDAATPRLAMHYAQVHRQRTEPQCEAPTHADDNGHRWPPCAWDYCPTCRDHHDFCPDEDTDQEQAAEDAELVRAAIDEEERRVFTEIAAKAAGESLRQLAQASQDLKAEAGAQAAAMLIACPRCHAERGRRCKNYKGQNKAQCKERTRPPEAPAPTYPPAPKRPGVLFDN